MSHLTDEQLAAELDRPRAGPPADTASRHLEGCEACRARLAEMAALEADLARALDHDPGEVYFASFADRVAARIAGERQPAAAKGERGRGWLAWWNSPRRLALAGGALALAAVAALAVVVSRDGGMRSIGEQVRQEQAPGTDAPRAEAPLAAQQAPVPRADDAPAPGSPQGGSPAEEAAGPRADAPAGSGPARTGERDAGLPAANELSFEAPPAASQRAMEVKTLPGGEQVAAPQADVPGARRKSRPLAAPPGFGKPEAQPMTSEATTGKDALASPARPETQDELEAREAGRERRATPAARRTQGSSAPVPAAARSLAGPQGEPKAAPSQPPAPGRAVPPAPARATAPSAEASAPTGAGGVVQQREEFARDAARGTRLCGTVRDPNGRPLGGVVLSAAETGASATSGADGSFCVEVPGARATLEAFAVGFRPHRDAVSVGAAGEPVGIVLQPVAALATDPRWGGTKSTFKAFTDAARPAVPAPSATEAARAASDAASRGRTVELWQRAADAWSDVAARAAGSKSELAEARFHVAEARVNAWRIGRTAAERAAARAAVDEYLPLARSSAERVRAEDWKRSLER